MKSILFVLFFGIGISAFSATTVTADHLSLGLERTIMLKEIPLNTKNTDEKLVAYNSYYAFEWLYKDSPFIKKLIVLA